MSRFGESSGGASPRPIPVSEPLIAPPLLNLLLQAKAPLTLSQMAQHLNWSVSQVRQELLRLEQAGCRFQEHGPFGLRLRQTSLSVWSDYLRWALPNTSASHILVYQRTTSTQDVARHLIQALGPAADAAIVLADEQTAGRGRLGRRWIAPAGTCLLVSRITWLPSCSCSLEPVDQAIDRLSLAAAVATAESLEQILLSFYPEHSALSPASVRIRWPNDVLLAGKKIAGILVEVPRPQAAVIGIGLNVSLTPEDLPDHHRDLARQLTSLALAGVHVDRLYVLTELIRQLHEALQQPLSILAQRWRARSCLLGQHVQVLSDTGPLSGYVLDLDPQAGLILQTDQGQLVHLHAATTTLLSFPVP